MTGPRYVATATLRTDHQILDGLHHSRFQTQPAEGVTRRSGPAPAREYGRTCPAGSPWVSSTRLESSFRCMFNANRRRRSGDRLPPSRPAPFADPADASHIGCPTSFCPVTMSSSRRDELVNDATHAGSSVTASAAVARLAQSIERRNPPVGTPHQLVAARCTAPRCERRHPSPPASALAPSLDQDQPSEADNLARGNSRR